jgi:hypothetical protein
MPGMSISAAASTTSHSAAAPSITASPVKSSVAKALGKRDFTVPDYMTPWYYYGRIDPACSCIITSANSPLYFSANETDTIYNTTIVSFRGLLWWQDGANFSVESHNHGDIYDLPIVTKFGNYVICKYFQLTRSE